MQQHIISLALLIAAPVALPTSHASAQSQAEMNRQAAKDFEKVDAQLNSVYQKLSQLGLHSDAEAAFATDRTRGGSMSPTIRYETMAELTQERIKQLKSKRTE